MRFYKFCRGAYVLPLLTVVFTLGLSNFALADEDIDEILAQPIDEVSAELLDVTFRVLEEMDIIESYSELDVEEGSGLIGYQVIYEGLKYIVVADNLDVHVACTFEDKPSRSRINEWNKDHRFTRAFITEEGKARIMCDIGATGTTVRNLLANLALGLNSGKKFYNEVL
ncbi:MAG: YbjN domain-containing protein [Planctomycetia bacterium]|nr:YbjN domain-containing protein [Planctomycetia bacterium]